MKSLVQLSLATLLLSTKVPSSAQLSNLLLMSLGAEEDEGEAERRRRERKLALLESVAAKLISSARTTPPPPPTPPTPPPALLPSANPSPMKLDLAGKELQEEEQEIQFDESAATATQSRTDKLPQASTSTSSRRITAASATTRNTVNSSFKSPLILASSSTSTLAHSASRRKLSATAPYPHLLIKLNSSTMASPLVTRRSTPLTQVNNSASSISCTTVKKSKIKFISPVFITSTTPCAQRRSTASITSKLHLEESSLQLTNIKTEINRMETLNRKMKLLQTHLKNVK